MRERQRERERETEREREREREREGLCRKYEIFKGRKNSPFVISFQSSFCNVDKSAKKEEEKRSSFQIYRQNVKSLDWKVTQDF